MKHLTEEQLVDHYYGEAENFDNVAQHLRQCTQCTQAYASLANDLSEIVTIEPPALEANYAAKVWQSIRPSLLVHEKPKRSWLPLLHWKGLSLATACLLLLSAAFFAGRQWEHRNPQQPTVATTATTDQGKQRVIVVVLGDHLDRSERLLVELKHADPSSEAPIQSEARELLSANRLYRESARQAGDPALASALDHLERVLMEVANEPAGLSQVRLDELQKEMNTDGLLFEVRVLRSRMQDDAQQQQQGSATVGKKGVSI